MTYFCYKKYIFKTFINGPEFISALYTCIVFNALSLLIILNRKSLFSKNCPPWSLVQTNYPKAYPWHSLPHRQALLLRLMCRPWTHLAHLVSVYVYVCVLSDPPHWSVWPDPLSFTRESCRETEGKWRTVWDSRHTWNPRPLAPPPFLSPCGVLTGLIKGNVGRAKTTESCDCCPAFNLFHL